VIVHNLIPELGLGDLGAGGMGWYCGRAVFEALSHPEYLRAPLYYRMSPLLSALRHPVFSRWDACWA